MLGNQHKPYSFLKSPVMDEERMTPRHWLGSVVYVSYSALTTLDEWLEGHLSCKKAVPFII